MSATSLARIAAAMAVLVLAASVALKTLTHIQGDHPDIGSPFATAVELIALSGFMAVGLLLILRRPESFIGWLLLLPMIGTFFNSYAEYALLARPGALPGGAAAAVADLSSWWPFVYAVSLMLLTFPSGRPSSPRRRFAAWAGGVIAAASFLLGVVSIERAEPPFNAEQNPLFIAALEPSESIEIASLFIFAPLALAIPVAAVDLFLRFRRARGEERQQFRWLAFAAALNVAYFPIYIALGAVSEELAYALFTLVLMGLPVSIGVAVLRYRLYEIDRVITRTLTYGLLTITLAVAYFGMVVGLQALLAPLSGGSDLAIALTTLAVAALFLPARGRFQRLVDRRFNRRAYDAARTIDAFSSRLREEIDLDTLRYEVLGLLDETMQPSSASIWLRRAPEATQ